MTCAFPKRLRAALAVLPLMAGAASAFDGQCLLEVQGAAYLDGTCNIETLAGGGFSIGTGREGDITYFAYVNLTGDGVAEGSWNAESGSLHAHAPLGALRRDGACWINETARVCAWR